MKIQFLLLLLLSILKDVSGEFLEMPLTVFNMSNVIKNLSQTILTGCYIECKSNDGCSRIGISNTVEPNLHTCHLIQVIVVLRKMIYMKSVHNIYFLLN